MTITAWLLIDCPCTLKPFVAHVVRLIQVESFFIEWRILYPVENIHKFQFLARRFAQLAKTLCCVLFLGTDLSSLFLRVSCMHDQSISGLWHIPLKGHKLALPSLVQKVSTPHSRTENDSMSIPINRTQKSQQCFFSRWETPPFQFQESVINANSVYL